MARKTLTTVGDMRKAKVLADARRFPETLQAPTLDPRIGILSRKGRPAYYAFIDGVYTEGTPESLNEALRA